MWVGFLDEFEKCKILPVKTREVICGFIKDNDMRTLSNGRYALQGNDYVNIFEYDTKENDGIFEIHKEFVDIHYTIIGEEKILFGDKYEQELHAYQLDGDYSLGKVDVSTAIESKGNKICVFLTGEPHKAGVILSVKNFVKKAVFKVKVD